MLKSYYSLVILILIFTLTGCEMRRETAASDLETMGGVPTPTLASLSAKSLTEATPVPTVINGQPTVLNGRPTATPSLLGTGQAAANPAEQVAPTALPVIGVTPVTPQKEIKLVAPVTQTITAQTFSPPAQEASTQTPVVVNALPEGGPVAANPPGGQPGSFGGAGSTYVVQAGDTLFSISLRYGATVEDFMIANNLTSDLIYEGQALNIPTGNGGYNPAAPGDGSYAPAPGYDPSLANRGGYHTVRAGETLFGIAQGYGASVEDMAAANNLVYPFVIYEGQTLLISGYGPGPQPQPAFDGNYQQPQGSTGGTHLVAPGETLYSIAVRYGTTPHTLVMLNNLANPDQIYVGQTLYLP